MKEWEPSNTFLPGIYPFSFFPPNFSQLLLPNNKHITFLSFPFNLITFILFSSIIKPNLLLPAFWLPTPTCTTTIPSHGCGLLLYSPQPQPPPLLFNAKPLHKMVPSFSLSLLLLSCKKFIYNILFQIHENSFCPQCYVHKLEFSFPTHWLEIKRR